MAREIASITVPIVTGIRRDLSQQVLGVSTGHIEGHPLDISLTAGGLFFELATDHRQTFGLDLNALCKAATNAIETHLNSPAGEASR